jgi:enamine deaminase RidA (YjgF/YER057c/UK114 family)
MANFAKRSLICCLGSLAAVVTLSGQARYAIPDEMPALPYPNVVTFPSTIKTTVVKVTSASAKTAEGASLATSTKAITAQSSQLDQALLNLDAALAKLRATKNDVVRLNVMFVGATFDQTFNLSSQIEKYFLVRTANSHVKFEPVRTIVGVKTLPDNAQIELDATVLQPATNPALKGVNADVANAAPVRQTVYIGGITSMKKDFSTRGIGNPQVQMREALANLDRALKTAGTSKANVDSLTIYMVPSGANPQDLQNSITELAKAYVPPNTKINTVFVAAACAQFLSIALEVEGWAPNATIQ